VERVIDILQREFKRTMGQCGAQTLAQITQASIAINGRSY